MAEYKPRRMGTILWLRWREFVDDLAYWLKLVDYDVHSRSRGNQAYAVYLIIFFSWWTICMIALATSFATEYGRSISPQVVLQIKQLAPMALFAGQVALCCYALRRSPWKMTAPDMAFVSDAMPVRTALVLSSFFQVVIRPLLVGCVLIYFATAVFGNPEQDGTFLTSITKPVLSGSLIISASFGIAWVIGLARMTYPSLRRKSWLWLVPIALGLPVLILQLAPAITFWQPYTNLVFQPQTAGLPTSSLALMAAVVVLAIAAIAYLGRRVNMVAVREESAVHAQMQEIGMLQLLAPSVYERAERDIKAVRIKPKLRLADMQGTLVLIARSALTYARQPLKLRQLVSPCAILIAAVGLAIAPVSPLVIFTWLYGAMLIRTSGLVHIFKADTEEAFLRQFLPQGPLGLLLCESLFPTCIVALASLVIIGPGLVAANLVLIGSMLTASMSIALALCNGAGLVSLTRLRLQPSPNLLIVLLFGMSLTMGYFLASPVAVLVVITFFATVLSVLIAKSPAWC